MQGNNREQELSDNDKRYKGREDVVFTDLDDGSAVLLHLESKYYYSLNDTGSFLWKLMEKDDGTTEEEMIKELCDAYDVDEGKAKKDVEDFVRDLSEQGLI